MVVPQTATTVMAETMAAATATILREAAKASLMEGVKFATGDAATILMYDTSYDTDFAQWRVASERAIALEQVPCMKPTKAITPHKSVTNKIF